MTSLTYHKPERIWIKGHSELNERWVQDIIAEDPTVLGLGDLILKDKERIQPHAGRLALLLQDSDSTRRYEVEVQLGKTDESHVIRTLEYWDVERKRYPQYEHCAVIVAEDITSRFLNRSSTSAWHGADRATTTSSSAPRSSSSGWNCAWKRTNNLNRRSTKQAWTSWNWVTAAACESSSARTTSTRTAT